MIEEEIKLLKSKLAHLKEYVESTLQKQEEMDLLTWYNITRVQETLEEASVILEDNEDD